MVLSDFSRKQAFLTHLSVSMVIFFVLLYLIAFEWFPSFYYTMDDGYKGTAVIFFVDVVLGPGLTLLVFKPGKKSLKFDMSVILILQLVALTWGIKSVYEDRPAVTVFFDGRFLVMAQSVAKDVDVNKISQGKSGGQKLAYLHSPESYDEKSDFMLEAYRHGTSSEYYYGSKFEPIDESNVQKILEYRLNLDKLRKENPNNVDTLNKYIETHPGYQEKYFFYPIKGRFNMGIAVFDRLSIRINEVLEASTYQFAEKPEVDIEELKAQYKAKKKTNKISDK